MNAANGNKPTTEHERATIEANVEAAVEQLLDALQIDWRNDHNTHGTPHRVAKMYVREVFAGRYDPPPKLTDFPNVSNLDQIYVVGPVAVRSACSHHLVPIIGRAWIAVLPGDRVIGLSKFSRLARWVMARPQIQEEATVQLADAIEQAIAPRGLAVIVQAQHLCMTWRGVKEEQTAMTTSVMRGEFRDDASARAEVLRLVAMNGGTA